MPPKDVFAPPSENPDNACFCLNEEGCNVPRGLFNMSACQFGSPAMMSWPHFFEADPKLLEAVEGLNPDPEKHQFYIDLQPVSFHSIFYRVPKLVLVSRQRIS